MFDSQGRFFFSDEIDMPVDLDLYKKKTEFIEPEKLDYVCFAIENSEGKHVSIANVFGVNERHGNFGLIGIVINPIDRGKGYEGAIGTWLFVASQKRNFMQMKNGFQRFENRCFLQQRLIIYPIITHPSHICRKSI